MVNIIWGAEYVCANAVNATVVGKEVRQVFTAFILNQHDFRISLTRVLSTSVFYYRKKSPPKTNQPRLKLN